MDSAAIESPTPQDSPTPKRRLSVQTKRMLGVLRQLRKGSHILKACESVGMAPSTFYRWRQKNPRMAELTESLVIGSITAVEDALYQACVQDRNISAIIFFLTNRADDRWKDRRALVNNTNVFNAKNEAPKNGPADTVESVLARIDKLRESLIPPSDEK